MKSQCQVCGIWFSHGGKTAWERCAPCQNEKRTEIKKIKAPKIVEIPEIKIPEIEEKKEVPSKVRPKKRKKVGKFDNVSKKYGTKISEDDQYTKRWNL